MTATRAALQHREDKAGTSLQPEVNIGTLGHVDNGKSTIVQALTGVWTARHSEELRRGITIRIGYADATFYECQQEKPPSSFSTSKVCPHDQTPTKLLRSVSFVDCPGHHSLMVTMLSGAALMEAIQEEMPTPKRDQSVAARLSILRSFDVNKPGTESDDLTGGVVGGSVLQGLFKKGDEIEIKPGIRVESSGKTRYETLVAGITSLQAGGGDARQIHPGGLVAIGTNLDPSVTKSDGLVGNVVGKTGSLPPTLERVPLDVKLFEKAVGTELLVPVQKVKMNEPLVLNAGTAVTSGIVSSAREDIVEVTLKKPICVDPGSKVALSRRIGESWRLIGFGTIR